MDTKVLSPEDDLVSSQGDRAACLWSWIYLSLSMLLSQCMSFCMLYLCWSMFPIEYDPFNLAITAIMILVNSCAIMLFFSSYRFFCMHLPFLYDDTAFCFRGIFGKAVMVPWKNIKLIKIQDYPWTLRIYPFCISIEPAYLKVETVKHTVYLYRSQFSSDEEMQDFVKQYIEDHSIKNQVIQEIQQLIDKRIQAEDLSDIEPVFIQKLRTKNNVSWKRMAFYELLIAIIYFCLSFSAFILTNFVMYKLFNIQEGILYSAYIAVVGVFFSWIIFIPTSFAVRLAWRSYKKHAQLKTINNTELE